MARDAGMALAHLKVDDSDDAIYIGGFSIVAGAARVDGAARCLRAGCLGGIGFLCR